jgi:hypothetical protein
VTNQLKAALDALNACPDTEAVADLLRRHGIRGCRKVCAACPIAQYLRVVGGGSDIDVGDMVAIVDSNPSIYFSSFVGRFIRAFDARKFPDLEAA